MTSLKTTCLAGSRRLQRLVRVALLVLFLGQLLTGRVRGAEVTWTVAQSVNQVNTRGDTDFDRRGSAEETRSPVPLPIVQAEAEKLIRETFEAEYSRKGAKDRRKLAMELLSQARLETKDLASRYVLLREAIAIASEAADARTAIAALDVMEAGYRIEYLDAAEKTLRSIPRSRVTRDTAADLVVGWLWLAERALALDGHDVADRGLKESLRSARSLKNRDLVVAIKEHRKYVDTLRKAFSKLSGSTKVLLDMPDDPAANEEIGLFLCLYKRDWEAGLPRLARAATPEIRSVATRDLAAPEGPEDQVALGKDWQRIAEEKKGVPRLTALVRAAHWHRSALPGLEGLARTRVQKLLVKLDRESTGSQFSNPLDLILATKMDALFFDVTKQSWLSSGLEALTVSRDGWTLSYENDSQAICLLATDSLPKEFVLTLEVSGCEKIGLLSADGRNRFLHIRVGSRDFQRVTVTRSAGKVTFKEGPRELPYNAWGGATTDMPMMLYVFLDPGSTCEIRELGIRSAE